MKVEHPRRTATAVRQLVQALADFVFPARCALCGAADGGDGLGCDEHRLTLAPSGPRCGRCALALPAMIADGSTCRECRVHAPRFRRVLALADYRDDAAVREWILAFKHRGRRDLARELGRALGARLACGSQDAARILVPVPLHALRRVERGYDQALLLARHAADVERLEVVRALRRTRATAVQGALGSPSRTANVHGAFRVARRLAARVHDRDVWLVDDVLTSGATANECARVLRQAGAASVSVLVVARAG